MRPLCEDFYTREDVVLIAKELLGKKLFSKIGDAPLTGGIIIETEAYKGPMDQACHAYNNRRTSRTEVMFLKGGIAYVYLCYGMHNLLNVVTAGLDVPHAVLIRAIKPIVGIKTMLQRRNKSKLDMTLTKGPGSVCKALGVDRCHNGISLQKLPLWIEEGEDTILEDQIEASKRIGVEYAKEDANLLWRFCVKEEMV